MRPARSGEPPLAPGTDEVGCPLCGAAGARPLARVERREYLACDRCGLIHLRREHRLDAPAERAHYLTHENDPADPGYRSFLDRLASPLMGRLRPGAEGLDYGSGPGPALSLMLTEHGYPTADYDPFFAPDPHALLRSYDFVTCSETAEHFFRPRAELSRLNDLLRPGGWLGVMTAQPPEERELARWYYARDPTHVCFYPSRTMEWIGARFGWAVERPAPNVTLFHKPGPPGRGDG